jgi:hypothetical protein
MKVTIEVESADVVSDGCHTIGELYDHRHALFVALMKSNPGISWIANKHNDGTMFDGYFIAGMDLPTGQISYHLKAAYKIDLQGSEIKEYAEAPEWDGHSSKNVEHRLLQWDGTNGNI